MAKTIKFFVEKVSLEASYSTGNTRQPLLEALAVLPEHPNDNTILGEFTVAEILDEHHKDEFLSHIGAEYVRQWLANNE